MNKLIIQEIEKMLSRSIVYNLRDTFTYTELTVKDLITNKILNLSRKHIFDLGKLLSTEYKIFDVTGMIYTPFTQFNDNEAAHVFDSAYNRWQKYFQTEFSDAQLKFYTNLLKNNHHIK